MLFTARGVVRTRAPMFTVIPIPKRARGMSLAALSLARRAQVAVPVQERPKRTKKDEKIVKKPLVTKEKPSMVKTVAKKSNGSMVFYTLQIRSFQDRAEALGFYRELRAKGYGVWAENYRDQEGRTWVRIFVGRFESRSHANAFQVRFRKMQGVQGLVVRKNKPPVRFRWLKPKAENKTAPAKTGSKDAKTTH